MPANPLPTGKLPRQLLVGEGMPVPGDAGDVGAVVVAEAEHVAVEAHDIIERGAVGVDRHVVEPGHPHGPSCSMNSRRMSPGASTNAMRRRPNGPDTVSGPHTT